VADISPLGDGRYQVSDGGHRSIAYSAGPADARWVFMSGRVYVIDTTRSGGARRVQDDDLALASPMPAKVAAVNVTVGQQIGRGDVLIMLEAMKMELPIRAPRDGRVKAVACKPGELVQPGVALVELEPESRTEPEHEPGTRNSEG
jgi:acetyl/propionyl-CoA carboxylase alpha subunit